MLCQNCGKNEANVKYTQIINGVKKQMNLCSECAQKLGIDDISFNMPSVDFSNFLGGMFDESFSDFIPSLIKPETLLCEKCGSSYDDFIKNGKFGCNECYDTFSNQIDSLLKNIHGVNRHIGRNGKMIEGNLENKIKSNNEIKDKEKEKQKSNDKENKKQKEDKKTNEDLIKELEERLKQEIQEERYEDAAKTRDEIKKLR